MGCSAIPKSENSQFENYGLELGKRFEIWLKTEKENQSRQQLILLAYFLFPNFVKLAFAR